MRGASRFRDAEGDCSEPHWAYGMKAANSSSNPAMRQPRLPPSALLLLLYAWHPGTWMGGSVQIREIWDADRAEQEILADSEIGLVCLPPFPPRP
jgi:hypothetical protein